MKAQKSILDSRRTLSAAKRRGSVNGELRAMPNLSLGLQKSPKQVEIKEQRFVIER
jgi:hypothetical protein